MKTSTLIATYVALVVLLVITVSVAMAPLPDAVKPLTGLIIAAIKAILVVLIFMELRSHRGVVRLFACAGLFWLLLLFLLTASDYLTRQWI